MIGSLNGVLEYCDQDYALIDVGGLGFQVYLSTRSLAALPALGEKVKVFTYLQLSETGAALFGFLELQEKALFEALITVHGIGPKGALAALSALSPHELTQAIVTEDLNVLQQIPGVGKKTASRLIVELKGSLEKSFEASGGLIEIPEGFDLSKGSSSALEALLSMGFTEKEATMALKGAPDTDDEVALIQYALKRLG